MAQHELTAGLEVHQQLSTAKLFCACPSTIRDDAPDFSVQRTLRAAAGESGETDIAAKHEQHKQKVFYYQGYTDSTCLVELDEEPVALVNPDALRVALQMAKLLHLQLVDEVHVMRKTVVDGSNTSGFQRTMLIGTDGFIEVQGARIRIEQLCLEEDSCKIVERTKEHDTYNLSRLGIPLLEITTGPDLHDAAQIKAVAAHIGMLLRSTEAVKRGLGTIRQDVNISVPGGTRVEIKGAQDLDNLSTLAQYETYRQKALLNLVQLIPAQQYAVVDVSAAFAQTSAKFIGAALKSGQRVLGLRLAQWNEALHTELMPGVRLGKELAGYAKAHGFGGLIHSAEDLSKYPIQVEVPALQQLLGCEAADAWLVMVGEQHKLRAFLSHVLIPRLVQLSVAIPKEVRKAEADGTNSYLRPMPGASRMYPETDVRVFSVDATKVLAPELLTARAARLEKEYDLSADLASQLSREGLAGLFEQWWRMYPAVGPTTIATLLTAKEKEIRTRHNISVDITELGPIVLEQLQRNAITLSSVEEILVKLAKKEPVDFAAYAPADESAIAAVVEQFIADNPGASQGLLMGKIMRHLENKVDGKLLNKLLSERLRGTK